jgi:hypothetical protein
MTEPDEEEISDVCHALCMPPISLYDGEDVFTLTDLVDTDDTQVSTFLFINVAWGEVTECLDAGYSE